MSEESEKQSEVEEICRRIENLTLAEHLSDEQKLTFARKALEIIGNRKDEEE